MNALGNDIVDLDHVKEGSDPFYKRFNSHVFTAPEFSRFRMQIENPRDRWALWAIKESAYKSSVKLGNRNRFNPKSMEIASLDCSGKEMSAVVRFGNSEITATCAVEAEYIYATSFIAPNNFISRILTNSSTDYYTQSSLVYTAAIEQLSQLKNFDISQLSIKKDSNQVPGFYLDNNLLEVDLSITHHGHFSAYIFGT